MSSHQQGKANEEVLVILVIILAVTLLIVTYSFWLLVNRRNYLALVQDSEPSEVHEADPSTDIELSLTSILYYQNNGYNSGLSKSIPIPLANDGDDEELTALILVGSYSSDHRHSHSPSHLTLPISTPSPSHIIKEEEASPLHITTQPPEEEDDDFYTVSPCTTSNRYPIVTPSQHSSKRQRQLQQITDEYLQEIDYFLRHRDNFYAPGYCYNIHRLFTLLPPPAALHINTIKDFTRFLKVQTYEFKVTSDQKLVELITLTPCHNESLRCQGIFHCVYNYCDNRWISNDSYANQFMVCEKCMTRVYPYEQIPLRKTGKSSASN